jgi:hypothetical protein
MTADELKNIYQCWQQDNDDYRSRGAEFISLAAKIFHVSESMIINILNKCNWFDR